MKMAEDAETAPLEYSIVDALPKEAKTLLAGGLAGSIAKTVTAPLSRATIMFQVHSMVTTKPANPAYADNLSAALRKMTQREGFFSLWKGNGTSVLHRFPYSAINFYCYELFKTRLSAGGDTTAVARLGAGALAGATACISCYPLDLVRTRLTSQVNSAAFYDGIGHCMSRIVKEEGIGGLYRGLGSTLAVQIPNLAVSYCIYGTAKEKMVRAGAFCVRDAAPRGADGRAASPERVRLHPVGSLLAGACAGIVSSLMTYPLDVVRRRQQVVGLHSRVRDPTVDRGPLEDLMMIARHEGASGLYRGILPEILKVIPVVSLTFLSYEGLKVFLRVDRT